MEDIRLLISEILLGLKELYQLRNYQGKSRPNNLSNTKRNDIFYNKLENELKPLLKSKGYTKIRKRIFIKKESDNLFYVHFALNKQRNGMIVDYGALNQSKLENDFDKIIDSINCNTKFKRLKPDFWKNDYQYPIKSNEKHDRKIILEIKSLLSKTIN